LTELTAEEIELVTWRAHIYVKGGDLLLITLCFYHYTVTCGKGTPELVVETAAIFLGFMTSGTSSFANACPIFFETLPQVTQSVTKGCGE